jgi:hypothetical protein
MTFVSGKRGDKKLDMGFPIMKGHGNMPHCGYYDL